MPPRAPPSPPPPAPSSISFFSYQRYMARSFGCCRLVKRGTGRPKRSFTSGSRSTRLSAIGSSSQMPATVSVRGKARMRSLSGAPQLRRRAAERGIEHERVGDRLMGEGVQLRDDAAADEAALRVARMQVVEGGEGLEARVGAQVLVEDADRGRMVVEREVASHETRAVREPVREGARVREQQEVRRCRSFRPTRPRGARAPRCVFPARSK